jgi:dTDP-4-amino-4,6-dideoxygalactose transaminase
MHEGLGAGIESPRVPHDPLNGRPALLDGRPAPLPNSERLASQGLALPMGQWLDEAAVRWLVDAVRVVSSPRVG